MNQYRSSVSLYRLNGAEATMAAAIYGRESITFGTTDLFSFTVRARLYRSNLKRAATAYRKARALVRGRKDDLSKTATTEITKTLIDVLNNLARAYVDIGSLTRAAALVKEILKLSPKNVDALRTKRDIAEAKKRDPTASGGTGRWSINRPWRRGAVRPPAIPSGPGGGR